MPLRPPRGACRLNSSATSLSEPLTAEKASARSRESDCDEPAVSGLLGSVRCGCPKLPHVTPLSWWPVLSPLSSTGCQGTSSATAAAPSSSDASDGSNTPVAVCALWNLGSAPIMPHAPSLAASVTGCIGSFSATYMPFLARSRIEMSL